MYLKIPLLLPCQWGSCHGPWGVLEGHWGLSNFPCGLLVNLPCIVFLPSTYGPPTSYSILFRTYHFLISPGPQSTGVAVYTHKSSHWACWWKPVIMTQFSWKNSLSWRPESSGWWLWILLSSSGTVPLRSKWIPIISRVTAPCHFLDSAFHGPPQFVCKSHQGPRPIPDLALPCPVQIPRRWLKYPTLRPLTFGCKSETPVWLEILGVLKNLIGSLAHLAQ